jgi:hypothetical protein
MRRILDDVRLVVAAIVLLLAALPAQARILAQYTVLGPGGAVARAVTDDASCPAIAVGAASQPMQVRSAADALFPLICETALPAGAIAARIGDTPLPVAPRDVSSIAVFGDSGCRVDARSGAFQSCNDEAAWPFARTSALAASLAPDLVIHVGDYLYRESPCPGGDAGCAGSPSGYGWPAWQADFFTPAAKLLAAAPWVVVRGNHESCRRAWLGFFRLLDPRPLPASCPQISETYRVDAASQALFVLDSADAPDVTAPDALVARYRAEFARIDAPPGAWILSHRPIWGTVRIQDALGISVLVNGNATLQAASGNALPKNVALVASGHIHLFEALGFADRRPPQIIFGTAGSALDRPIDADLKGREIGGTTYAYARTAHIFGVTTLDRAGEDWTATLRDAVGAPLTRCTIAGPDVACTP